jgi:D-inositol-3-phosphate glycosyltransferase
VASIALLSMHTSPLAQPGSGDGGGMNVYVRELASALARQGARCEVFTRRESAHQPESVWVEPGMRVHFVDAGPVAAVAKEHLPTLVDEWTTAVGDRLAAVAKRHGPLDLIHANYWLSGMAGHRLKHLLDVPLAATFHTLERVKGRESGQIGVSAAARQRAAAEAAIIGCSDAVLASCHVEAQQLVELYGAAADRVELVPPAVDHAIFAPGRQAQARRATGLPEEEPVVLFVGRIQPLKGLSVAVEALGCLVQGARSARTRRATLVVIGGPSGEEGASELARAHELAEHYGVSDRIRWVRPQRHEMLSSFYRAADVCVVPSRSESFGLVALEAAACGVPVVASAVGGLRTLIRHGSTGYLVQPGYAEGFAHFLGEVLADRSLARSLGQAATQLAGQYTWAAAGGRLLDLQAALGARELVACS